MTEKNRKREQAKKYRCWFNCKMGTITFRSKKYPSRQQRKKVTADVY